MALTFRSKFLAALTIAMIASSPLAAGQQNDSTAQPETSALQSTATQSMQAPAEPTLQQLRTMPLPELDALGDQLRQAKDYLGARDCYREEIRRHRTAAAYNKIAIAELLLRHPAEAEKAAKHAVHKDRHMAEAWNNLGVSRYMQNHFEAAIGNYRRAISLEPNSASFHNNLAAVLMDSHQMENAVAEYRKALELDPQFLERPSQNGISAHMNSPHEKAEFAFAMARLFAASGDLERSLHFLRSAMEDGYPEIDEVYRDKEFSAALKDERFATLMRDRPVSIR